MSKKMLINAVHTEQKRMAIVEDGKLVEFNIQMAVREPITGNIYKGIVMKVERGLQAAFINYGGRKDGFLPLRDVSSNNYTEMNGYHEGPRQTLKTGQEILVQVLREVSERKGALLTSYISLPGRYLVLLPNKESSGISRKIEDEADRKRLKELVEQIKTEDGIGFIVRTAGMNRTKQELARDYQHLLRLWTEIKKKADEIPAPALIYQESAFGVRSLRDYFTPDIDEILVDDAETFRQMRSYCKAVAPRNMKIIKLDKEKTPLFEKHQLEEQIRLIYQERADLKSGGYLIINPTEAMITIDVNSGRGSHKRNVEETAFQTNMEAAEEIARQLRLRDLGGLIAIDFIDMMDQKHNTEVEKAFKKALTMDRARIQLAHISKFGILELSRQKKQSTIQEISYTSCPYCHGLGVRPSLEYIALNAYRKVETQAVRGAASELRVFVPPEVADYLQNQKREEICRLENDYGMSINLYGNHESAWEDCRIETIQKEGPIIVEAPPPARLDQRHKEKEEKHPAKGTKEKKTDAPVPEGGEEAFETPGDVSSPDDIQIIDATDAAETKEEPPLFSGTGETTAEQARKKLHRRPRRRRKTPAEGGTAVVKAPGTAERKPEAKPTSPAVVIAEARNGETSQTDTAQPRPKPPNGKPPEKKVRIQPDDPLYKLRKIFEEFDDI